MGGGCVAASSMTPLLLTVCSAFLSLLLAAVSAADPISATLGPL